MVKDKEHRWNVGAPIVGDEVENSRDLFARHVELFEPDDLAGLSTELALLSAPSSRHPDVEDVEGQKQQMLDLVRPEA